MAKKKLANPPPETEVLATGELPPEQGKELAETGKIESPVETPVEDTGIELKPISEMIDVGPPRVQQPPEVPPPVEGQVEPEEVTHDPLKDTQARMTKEIQRRQELEEKLERIESDMRALVTGIATEKRLHDSTQVPGEKEPPPEWFDPNPTEEEQADPIRYTVRMRQVDAFSRAREEKAKAITNFVKENPDWRKFEPGMTEISDRVPSLKYGPDSLSNLLEWAQDKQKIRDMEKTLKEAEEAGFTAGAKMEKSKTEVFVKPTAASPRASITVPDFEHGLNPATNKPWTSDEITQWAREHGLYKES